ncbi:Ale2p NDAI_0A04720 [Naumovozyma dairenensis CBS 421]|uniref:TLC domain-containing protein n=1 Tax=Naumovozyma dairenensis (strain ATCC 10597 / BCRC 20456 / CBS 421 / NBRC 0211 / NRRL Y-12639) TaxID=1071378 RepID=G0W490_NAUDC|nr:hypothetical protein NDAI_0A04720 [Naumovozyma dairenensis CBS 421]CCD22628.1 hypothetical protein NDAI_0A04720 [Naumovozyma dairenensis CBS 421]
MPSKMAHCLDYVINALLELPQPSFFRTHINPYLARTNLLTTDILDNLHSIVFISIFYHIVYLIGKYIIFPPFVSLKLKWDQQDQEKQEAIAGKKNDNKTPHHHHHHKKRYNALVIQSSIHLISLLQSIVVLYLSFDFLLCPERSSEPYQTSESRIFGSNRETQVICIYAIGYFLWDTIISLFYSSTAFVLHGIISTVVFTIGLKPYIQYYAPVFLMFELSNPFLNFRWFGIKLFPSNSKIGDTFLLINNLILMIMFFFARIAWGWFQIGKLIYDYYQVRNDPSFLFWDSAIIVSGNFVLDILNVIWFSTMVSVAFKVLKQGSKAAKSN